MKKKELGFITVLYGIAPVLVILGHSHPLHCGYPGWLGQVTAFLYTFHMALFFIIAGILLDYTSGQKPVMEWWVPKAKRLAVPYVALTAVAWVPKVMLGSYMNDDMEISVLNFVKILLIPRAGIWGHFWFIPVYLLLMLGCGWLWKRMKTAPAFLTGGYYWPQ